MKQVLKRLKDFKAIVENVSFLEKSNLEFLSIETMALCSPFISLPIILVECKMLYEGSCVVKRFGSHNFEKCTDTGVGIRM